MKIGVVCLGCMAVRQVEVDSVSAEYGTAGCCRRLLQVDAEVQRMSYNITSWRTKELKDFRVPIRELYPERLRSDLHPEPPVISMDSLRPLQGRVAIGIAEGKITGWLLFASALLEVDEIKVYGESSGHVYEDVLKPAFARSTGKLVARLVWEGGDTVEMIRVENGVLTEEEI